MLRRIEAFCGKLDALIMEPPHPSLLHGDVWTTNVLASGGRITGFIDPAVYYGHPEIELAFTTLFGTFGDAFFKRYHELRSQRGSGRLADDLNMHLCLPRLLQEPLSQLPRRQAVAVTALLAVWQAANAAGFAAEYLRSLKLAG